MALDLKLYDTLTREKRVFIPIDPAHVRMYVCGPTVYDFAHIGNARPVIVFDVLYRLLRHIYGPDHVTYVRNITDVDDKINARAAERGISIRELTEGTYNNFKADVAALGCLPPTIEPRATEHIEEMKALIERLVKSGHAYVAEDNVLFDVPSMPDYGKLSNRPLDEMIAGARVEVAPYKRHPTDFVLWKPSKPGEPSWPSPAGIATPGRPGWHIECSAMAWKHLGETFDIHGGGIDLVFPHHENEIAQSRCAFHTGVMANFWMHNGFLQVEGEKMAKSSGNFVVIDELTKKWHETPVYDQVAATQGLTLHESLRNWRGRAWSGSAIRLAMLGTHYRQPINWTHERLADSEKELFSIADEFSGLISEVFKNDFVQFSNWIQKAPRTVGEEFIGCLLDDLNTHGALSVLRGMYSRIAKDLNVAATVLASLELLGLMDRASLFLHSSPILRGFFDPEAIKGAFLVGRKLQVGILNNDQQVVNEVKTLLAQWHVNLQDGPSGMLFLVRDSADAKAGRDKIESLVHARSVAKKAKDFKEADRIRDELKAMGIELEDTKDGKTKWEIAR